MQHYVLGDVITEISERENNPSNSEYERFVGLEHYVSGEVEIENYGSTANLNSAMKVFNSGDILVARRNVYLKRASVVYFDGLTSGDSIVLRPKNETIGRILPFILNTDDFWDYADQYSDGTMSKRLSPKVLKQYEFDLPDDNLEQLADILWAMVDVKKSYQRLLKRTDELVKSQFIEMFGEEKIEDCRWPVMFMEDVFSITSSRRILKSEWKTEGNIPFIRVRDMVQLANKEPLTNEFFVSDEFYNSRPENEKVKAGDIIISATSTIGRTYVIKQGERFYFKDADVLLFRKKQEINEEFFTYGLTMPTVWTQIEGGLGATTVAHFLISKACKIKQPLPPIELQEEFALLLKQCDKSKFELKQAIEGVDLLIKSMIQQELN